MQQHRLIKQKYPDAILLFRVGDFYETFGEDALISSKVLGITLTKRNNGAAASSELAGFPHHALDNYLHKLVQAGYRVAVCDQLEDPKQAKGIVRRGVTELVTPGIATHEKLLDHRRNHFLAALQSGEKLQGLALLDISTGEFLVTEGSADYMDKLLQSLQPAEVLLARPQQKSFREQFGNRFHTYALESWIFDPAYAADQLRKHFQTHSLKGFGIEDLQDGLTAAGVILHYLRETEHPHLRHINTIRRIDRLDHLWMDRFTVRNLELVGGPGGGADLLSVLDSTCSPMGARLMKRWMLFPLTDPNRIRERHAAVAALVMDPDLRAELGRLLRQAGDLERLASRIALQKAQPRELVQTARSLELVAAIRQACTNTKDPLISRLSGGLDPCPPVLEKITAQLEPEPPATVQKGGVFRDGVDEELDRLRSLARGGKEFLQTLHQREMEATGISSLKLGFNSVFGYYLEVTHTHRDRIPDHWTRKQTLANAERFVTPELKSFEEQITGAEAKILELEAALYESLIRFLQDFIGPMQANAQTLAVLDCLNAFAQNAVQYRYCRPELHEGKALELRESRHPVIERHLPPGEEYVANDIRMDPDDCQIIILTGPNMSGKSALLRQTALITLMAHMGSFVPAASARIPLTDKIFTRVGASDNLSAGESTFMVEMNETATILNNMSDRSLILLDEIGRGTSTYDGISIAWSIAEFLHEAPERPKTLFATHYHELNALEERFPRIKNFHITNRELDNKVIFLRKLAPGGSTHSFGIHVARMAGMPPELIRRANEVLAALEEKQPSGKTTEKPTTRHAQQALQTLQELSGPPGPQVQLSIFDTYTETFQRIREVLEGLDINNLTPVEALMKLNEIKNMLK